MSTKAAEGMANSIDTDEEQSSESILFAQSENLGSLHSLLAHQIRIAMIFPTCLTSFILPRLAITKVFEILKNIPIWLQGLKVGS